MGSLIYLIVSLASQSLYSRHRYVHLPQWLSRSATELCHVVEVTTTVVFEVTTIIVAPLASVVVLDEYPTYLGNLVHLIAFSQIVPSWVSLVLS